MNLFFSGCFLNNIIFLFCVISFSSCIKNPGPDRNEVIKTEYPNLAEKIIERDFDGLWAFIDHDSEKIREQTWKAIAKSDADDLQAFLDYSIQQDQSHTWYALSFHPLNNEQVNRLTQLFSTGKINSETVCEIFFRKGNLNSLNMLLDKPELLTESEICSQAAGGILSRVRVDDLTKRKIFDLAFNHMEKQIMWRNLLYGFYRAPLNRPTSDSILMDNLSTMLDHSGESFSMMMDEYIVRIAGKAGFMNVMERRTDRELNHSVQLSNELARNVILFEDDELNHPHIKRLLRHQVHNVVAQMLQSLLEFESIPEDLLEMIHSEIVPNARNAEVFAEALNLLVKNGAGIGDYRSKLELMDAQNEYLKHRLLPLFSEIEPEEEYLHRLQREIEEGGIGGFRAVQVLTNYYSQNYQNSKKSDTVKSMVHLALTEGDESVFSAINTLLLSPELFSEDDYEWFYNHYINFAETSQWEKAGVLDEVLEKRYPGRFEALEIKEKPFRIPDWERLYEMGIQPFWVLETNKGTIEIQLDPLAAPFTVSSIDSLTRAGAYNDVPFHRLVRNFVIQGGDIDRKDGFGGPDYKLPTEPSFQSFERGMVGIASSGTDTEGSQFFIMLQWSPHLDGNYTIFGEVTKGMEVADRIQMGDRVVTAEIRQ